MFIKNAKKKISRKGIVKELDNLTSKIIRLREGRCICCGTLLHLSCGHLFTRQAYSTRWDIHWGGNCYTQCSSCNLSHEYDTFKFTRMYQKEFGVEAYDQLHARHKRVKKYTNANLQFLVLWYTKILSEYTRFLNKYNCHTVVERIRILESLINKEDYGTI